MPISCNIHISSDVPQDQALGVANRGSPGTPLAPPISRFLASTTVDLVEIEPKRSRVQLR